MATKMPDVSSEANTWKFYRFQRSGELIDLQEMPEDLRMETVRNIIMAPFPGVAYDEDMKAIATQGSVKSDQPGDARRHYAKEELEAFSIGFLKKKAEERGIKVSKSASPDKLITAILEWQMGLPAVTIPEAPAD